MTERTIRFVDRTVGALCALIAVFSAMVIAAKLIHGVDDWWHWSPFVLIGMRLAWVSFRDARTPAERPRSAL